MEEYVKTLMELIEIPGPSYREEKVAEYIEGFLKREIEKTGYEYARVYSDEIHNVYVEFKGNGDSWFMVTAHTDTVFPDMEGICAKVENGRLYGLGAKDNRVNVCALLYTAKELFEKQIRPEYNTVFVFDVCEEGLGNLKGCRKAYEHYAVKRMIALDLDDTAVYACAVGSVRYKVMAKSKGGHALNDFGSPNAIAIMAEFIHAFYQTDVTRLAGKTTFNVGTIQGGTSVNTIAANCEALVEWRSDRSESLTWMQERFDCLVEQYGLEKELLGIRPSMGIFTEETKREQEELTESVCDMIEAETGRRPRVLSGSTDCNIPLSEGVPAVCFGACIGAGEHTREEYVELDSLEQGRNITTKAILKWSSYENTINRN